MLARLRYGMGTALLPVTTRVRRALRRPDCPPLLARPQRRRRREPALRLSRAVVASDLNREYLDFWPLARQAWRDVVGIDPVLVLVAEPERVPDELRHGDVQIFTPVPGLRTSFQAQCIRLLFPALVETDGAVVVSDIDILPLNGNYFHRPLEIVRRNQFVAYRDALLNKEMLAMVYLAAHPDTWREVFEVASLDDVRARLSEWGRDTEYAGEHGGAGWFTDQRILYDTLVAWGRRTGRVWIFPDAYCGHKRLDRLDLQRDGQLFDRRRREIVRRRYSDYHCLVPHEDHREVNEEVLRLAAEAARRR